jgi:GNAT superfamily N-acetyltransferase
MSAKTKGEVVCRALTPARWADAEAVFQGCGDARGCWCAFWRMPRPAYRAGWGARNRAYLRRLVESGAPVGVVAYRGGEPVGWRGVAPRSDLSRLARSRVLAPVDALPVWSINCFIVPPPHRRSGLMRPLIAGAVAYTKKHGAPAVEAYPFDPQRKMMSGEVFTGLLPAFLDQGFREVARRSPIRPIVRRRIP